MDGFPPEKEKSSSTSSQDDVLPNKFTRPRLHFRRNALNSAHEDDFNQFGRLDGNSDDTTTMATSSHVVLNSEDTPRKRMMTWESDVLKDNKRRSLEKRMDQLSGAMSDSHVSQTAQFNQETMENSGNSAEVSMEAQTLQDNYGPPSRLGTLSSVPCDENWNRGGAYTQDPEHDDVTYLPDLERRPLTKRTVKPSRRICRKEEHVAPKNRMTSKLFEDVIHTTPEGNAYATVADGCLTELMKKTRIIDLLTNPVEIELIRQSGWFLSKPPQLPPLVTDQACYAFYLDGTQCKDAKELSTDGLRPWSATKDPSDPNSRNIKPNVRRHAVARLDGMLKTVKIETGLAEYFLTEYTGRLPREERLHKKIFYLSQDNKVYGNVLILYNYVSPGLYAPMPICSNAPMSPLMEVFLSPFAHQKYNSEKLTTDSYHDDDVVDMSSGNEDVTGIEVIEETTDHHHNWPSQKKYPHEERPIPMHPDTINGGFDSEFNEDSSEDDDKNPNPFYEKPRKLSTGHVYLTIRHKNKATSMKNALEWIANTNYVEQRGILNATKPAHPPLITNSRAYGFFVKGSEVDPHLINRDDFSPWSGNGMLGNPISYRTKSRKYGVECQNGTFVINDDNIKQCPYHLVYLYTTNPREPRMKKKIYYLMDAQSKIIVSHALIVYDYQSDGDIPKLNSGDYTYKSKKELSSSIPDLYDEVSDNEKNRECPFKLPVKTARDGTRYMQLEDEKFWNDKNRQLQYLVNHPELIEQMDCLNSKVPQLPPTSTKTGIYIFFLNGNAVHHRTLTADHLAPWSENVASSPSGIAKRAKKQKLLLGINRNNELRVYKANSNVQSEYELHVYTAILPRCTRLQKKVVYVLKNERSYGYSLIMYRYMRDGLMPQPIYGSVSPLDDEQFVPEWTGDGPMTSSSSRMDGVDSGEPMTQQMEIMAPGSQLARPKSPILKENLTMSGPRGAQRYDALWRIAQQQCGSKCVEEAFDEIFGLLLEKNEARLLQCIHHTFDVDITEVEDHQGLVTDQGQSGYDGTGQNSEQPSLLGLSDYFSSQDHIGMDPPDYAYFDNLFEMDQAQFGLPGLLQDPGISQDFQGSDQLQGSGYYPQYEQL